MVGYNKKTVKMHIELLEGALSNKKQKIIRSLFEKHQGVEGVETVTVKKHGYFFPYGGKVEFFFWHKIPDNHPQMVGRLIMEIKGSSPNITYKLYSEGIIDRESIEILRKFLIKNLYFITDSNFK